jgi:ubiquinone/menaquinone biosynthesis C-methylase UbiE
MNEMAKNKLDRILSKAGDVSFRRRVIRVFDYLDIQSGDVVLDCGCGEGFYTMTVKELYGDTCTVVSLDIDVDLIKKAQEWLGDGRNGGFVAASMLRIPFREKTFTKIIFSEVLEHVADDRAALAELKRVLADKGVIALTVPNHNYPLLWDPLNKVREWLGWGHFSKDNGFWGGLWAMHLRLYYERDLEAVVAASGFSILKRNFITHYSLPFNHMILYVGKRIGGVISLPMSLAKAMEKFEWQQEQRGFAQRCIGGVMGVIDFIDRFNDAVEDRSDISTVCIGMKLSKQDPGT